MEKTIVSRVRALLKSQEIDEMELAKRINKHPSTVYRLMKGENEPTKATVKLIADGLGVNFEWLMKGEGPKDLVTKEKIDAPWKDEAYTVLKEERNRLVQDVQFFKDLIKSSGLNFLRPVKRTA